VDIDRLYKFLFGAYPLTDEEIAHIRTELFLSKDDQQRTAQQTGAVVMWAFKIIQENSALKAVFEEYQADVSEKNLILALDTAKEIMCCLQGQVGI
jgi:hypothetical protein